MEILPGFKLCRKGLHQYSAELKRCPECYKQALKNWKNSNPNYQSEWVKNNKEKRRISARKYRVSNPDKCKNRVNNWKKRNKDRVKQYNKTWDRQNKHIKKRSRAKWKSENAERVKELNRQWAKRNLGKLAAKTARRNALKKRAIPAWADHEKIKLIYLECARLTKSTGIDYQVDHIYPLVSKYMCGLHVETNLQIITKKENTKKGNRTWPGQLDCQR